MQTHFCPRPVRRLAAGLLALALAAGLALPLAFARGWALPDALAASAPQSAAAEAASGDAEYTPPADAALTEPGPQPQEGFVRGEAETAACPPSLQPRPCRPGWM